MTTLMKDSGIDWIGKIPEGWEIKRLKDLYELKKGVNAGKFNFEYVRSAENKGEYPVYSGQTENNGVMGRINTFEYDDNKGAILTTTVGAKAMTVRKVIGKYSLSQNCGLLINKRKGNISYSYYLVYAAFSYAKSMIPNHMQPSFRKEDLNNIYVPYVNLETQQKIADYLDVEVSKLDKQVSLLERKYALLGDYKDALIFETVTQGLDKAVPMKDSGIDWIGKIPEGWKIIKCGNIFNISSGTTPNTKNEMFYNSKDVNWLNSGDFHNSYINDTKNKISFFAKEYLKLKEFKSGSIVIAMYGANIGDVGFLNIDTTVNQACAVLVDKKNKKIINKYFYYLFINKKNEFIGKSYGGGQKNINQGLIHQSYLQLPPLETQQEIADYLDVEVAKLDKQRELIKRKVELLKEYKEALIFEVVTGKKEVK